MAKRVDELDFLKCVFIVLMVAFHLIYIGDRYPYAKQLVYTFHIPAFLLISGYLVNLAKPVRAFLRTWWWILVPYTVMESGYVVMSVVLPVRDGIDTLDGPTFFNKLILHPLGPYWYLHTLMVGSLCAYGVKWAGRYSCLSDTYRQLLLLSAVFALVSVVFHLAAPSSLFYYGGGIALRWSGLRFTGFFRGSWWSLPVLALLAGCPAHLDRFTLAGVAITYLAISVGLALFRSLPPRISRYGLLIGRNTFVIFVFSPIFTLLSRGMVPWFRFEPTGMLFLAVALCFVLTGCLGMAGWMDKCHISRYFWGKARMLQGLSGTGPYPASEQKQNN